MPYEVYCRFSKDSGIVTKDLLIGQNQKYCYRSANSDSCWRMTYIIRAQQQPKRVGQVSSLSKVSVCTSQKHEPSRFLSEVVPFQDLPLVLEESEGSVDRKRSSLQVYLHTTEQSSPTINSVAIGR